MTQEAERYAHESMNGQKQLADSEQQREEFKIQAQETIKQLNSFRFDISQFIGSLDGRQK